MLLVAGSHCAVLSQPCLKEGKAGCAEFSRAECRGGEQRLQFCVDRYEYPNLPGVVPATMIHFDEARRSCEAEGKRLCRENEWTVACEGIEYRPFSYGFGDQPNVCNIGQSVEPLEWQVFSDPERTATEMSRVDARSASGSRPGCVSSAGVYDLLGNAAEWVSGEDPSQRAVLKGGDFRQEYATCRLKAKIAHRLLRLPYNGFRCCADPLVHVEGPVNGQGSK
jgi:formylglycine-generating enzyme required for sulfatase activity